MTNWIKELIWDMRGEQVTVECARCGEMVEIENATPEEAGEWECLPCNIRCNDHEMIGEAARLLTADDEGTPVERAERAVALLNKLSFRRD